MSDRKCWPQVRAACKARDYEALVYGLMLAAEPALQKNSIPDWVLDLVVELGKLERARLQYGNTEQADDKGAPTITASPPDAVLRLLGDL